MKERKRPSKVHFAWVVLLGCCLMTGATVGVVVNCRGMFFQPVCAELGFDLSEFTAQQIFFGIGAAVSTPIAFRCFGRRGLGALLPAMLVLYAGACAAMGAARNLAAWFVLAAVQGIASSFVSLMPLPILIDRWFSDRKGLAVSVSGTACGVLGALFNFLGARVIAAFGWRVGYLFSATACLALGLPAVLWMIRWDPGELGLEPYRSKVKAKRGAEAAVRTPQTCTLSSSGYRTGLLLFSVIVLAATLSTGIVQHINKFAASVGFADVEAAKFASCLMVGNIVGKLLLGRLNDRWGMGKAVATGIGIIAFGAVLGGTIHQAAAIPLGASAFCLGFTQGLYTVGLPMIVYHYFSREDVARVTACQTMIFNLAGCVCVSLFSLLYEAAGNYGLPMAVIACYAAVEAAALLLLDRYAKGKRSRRRTGPVSTHLL